MTLAAASARVVDASQPPADPGHPDVQRGSQLLIREIQEILSEGAEESRLVNHLLVWNAVTDWTSLHRVVPLSHCALCGGASAVRETVHAQTRLSVDDPPEITLQGLAGWIDARTGVIPRLMLELQGADGTELPIVATTSPPFAMKEDGTLRRLSPGWGKGLTISEAILSAAGEAVERYSASLPEAAQIVWSRPEELGGEFLDPASYEIYAEFQYDRPDFPYVRFDPTVRHPWVLGRWLHNAEPVWLPAVFVFLWMQLLPEHQICQGTSNGLAASTDMQHATLRAVLELVERDAFLAAWFTGTAGQRIELDQTFDPRLSEVLKTIESCGAATELYFLPTAACGSVAICLALGDGIQYPGVTIGLAADVDPLCALRRAILELGQTGSYLRRLLRSGAAVAGGPSGVRGMLQHAIYYFPANERLPLTDCALHGRPCLFTISPSKNQVVLWRSSRCNCKPRTFGSRS
jgi:ribosomal protein S12 methylthiotransferase accessory factor